jgi:aerobic-type carbon monoxide dehydrogenase small subunit (CoxS/CutS family)
MLKTKKGKQKLSRRKFLKTAGMAGGAVAVGMLVKPARRARASTTQRPPLGPGEVEVRLNVNGKDHVLRLEPRVTLVEALRERLDLTGTKRTCDHGECGACTVLMDGRAVCSCMTLAVNAQGKKIITIEGLAQGKLLGRLQKAFVEYDALQCGFCTPGMIMSLKALLDQHPRATSAQIRAAVAGNYCRCGALPNILKAANAVARA